jgi:hypothetical protein
VPKKIKKIIPILIGLLFFGLSFISFRANAIFPAGYHGFPLGFSPLIIYCNCPIGVTCECPQPPFIFIFLVINILFWGAVSFGLGLVVRKFLKNF